MRVRRDSERSVNLWKATESHCKMTQKNLLSSQPVLQAVSRISQRAEKQVDTEKVLSSFVDSGVIDQLENGNSQILYGRRGTGKTHAPPTVRKVVHSV